MFLRILSNFLEYLVPQVLAFHLFILIDGVFSVIIAVIKKYYTLIRTHKSITLGFSAIYLLL